MSEMICSRRGLLGGAMALGGGLAANGLIGGAAQAAFPAFPASERRLAFRNVHTNERFDARFFGPKGFDVQGLAELNHGLRDWRNGEIHPMDPALFDLLASIRDSLGIAPRKGFDLISGYRSPQTNETLRENGGAHTGVASRSQHMLGRATDVAMPGVALDRLRLAALSKQRGGVGFYPADGFVHVDTGRVRSW